MPDPPDVEQIERSKMSFAEHLEELRRALFKSLLALVLGSLVGFSVGWSVVDYIQTPLRDALETYSSAARPSRLQLERLEECALPASRSPTTSMPPPKKMADDNLVPRRHLGAAGRLAGKLWESRSQKPPGRRKVNRRNSRVKIWSTCGSTNRWRKTRG